MDFFFFKGIYSQCINGVKLCVEHAKNGKLLRNGKSEEKDTHA